MSNVLIHVKSKEENYLRLIVIDNTRPIFLERYIDWSKWQAIQNEIFELKREINTCIEKGNYPENEFKILSRFITDFFVNNFLPLENKKVFVIWGADLFFPFELLTGIVSVVNVIKINNNFSYVNYLKKKFSFVYSEEIKGAGKEVFELSKIVESRFKDQNFSVEVFSEKFFDSYKVQTDFSNFIYFSSHGRQSNGKGEIKIGEKWTDSFSKSSSYELAFLNCCEIGENFSGLVGNLLSSGTKMVIASPFSLFDDYFPQKMAVQQFYRNLHPEDIMMTVNKTQETNDFFRKYYRVFVASNFL
jgi:hypothetical protein